jgi:hypothetical protein
MARVPGFSTFRRVVVHFLYGLLYKPLSLTPIILTVELFDLKINAV